MNRESKMSENDYKFYFGMCPLCRETYEARCINVGASHWYFCKEHKLKWNIGANLFSSWKEQTEEAQRRIYDELDFDEYLRIPIPNSNGTFSDDASAEISQWEEDARA